MNSQFLAGMAAETCKIRSQLLVAPHVHCDVKRHYDVGRQAGFVVRRRHRELWSGFEVLLRRRAAGSNAHLSAHGVIVHQQQGCESRLPSIRSGSW
jgi:hypothetical protein